MCDQSLDMHMGVHSNESSSSSGSLTFHLLSPSYPNEYANNLECKCSIQADAGLHMQLEVLEFDLESSSDDIEPHPQQQQQQQQQHSSTSLQKRRVGRTCLKDYLSIVSEGDDLRLCGNYAKFSTLLLTDSTEDTTAATSTTTQVRLFSDDALNRRGLWLRFSFSSRAHSVACPSGFVLVDATCLKIVNKALTWYEAHAYCTYYGYSMLAIHSFAFERKLNRLLFDTDDTSSASSSSGDDLLLSSSDSTATSNTSSANRPTPPPPRKFWVGVKRLNQTNWFDAGNQPIEFARDERAWWPWLVVDSQTLGMGSCVAKKRDHLVLDDCYKLMPFACQYNSAVDNTQQPPIPIGSRDSPPPPGVRLRCGKRAELTPPPSAFATSTSTSRPPFASTKQRSDVLSPAKYNNNNNNNSSISLNRHTAAKSSKSLIASLSESIRRLNSNSTPRPPPPLPPLLLSPPSKSIANSQKDSNSSFSDSSMC